jgi:ABC-type nitrate/sulfonate/bicarbonate transport system permease component
VPAVLILIAFLAIWQIYSSTVGPGPEVLPSPLRVVEQGWADRSQLWDNTVPTLTATVLGFCLSLALAFALSIAIDRFRPARKAVMPVLVTSQTLPLIVLAPLVIVWFGFGLMPKVVLIVLVTFFPLTVALSEGYATTEADAEALFRTLGASWWQTFRRLRLPTSLPFFFTGLRIAITYAVVGAVFAEYAGSERGLGIYMQNAKNAFRTDLVLAAVAVTTALTLLLFGLTFAIERIAMPWNRIDGKGRR